MIDILLGGSVVIGTLSIARCIRKKQQNFNKKMKKIDESISFFIKSYDLNEVDFEVMDTSFAKKYLKKNNEKDKLIDFKFFDYKKAKGYDIIEATALRGYSSLPHKHNKSTEFFYVIDGKLEVLICPKTSNDCLNCGEDCIFKKSSEMHTKVLTRGKTLTINPGQYHIITAPKKTKFLVFAIPSIFEKMR